MMMMRYRSRHRARRVEMVRFGCGRGDQGPSGDQIRGGGGSRARDRPGASTAKGAACSAGGRKRLATSAANVGAGNLGALACGGNSLHALTSQHRGRELSSEAIMADVSEFSIVTYLRRPGHWRAAITPKVRIGSVGGERVRSIVTPVDFASEAEAPKPLPCARFQGHSGRPLMKRPFLHGTISAGPTYRNHERYIKRAAT